MESSLSARDRVGVQDFVLLVNYSSEDAFVDNLQKRFKENLIYTYIGPVLISVNPYKELPIYTDQTIKEYTKVHFYEASPHVFAITDTAYHLLKEENHDQCILISGESGSGKTEASKKVLEYIAAATKHKKTVELTKNKLLQSNPVLEAFGNAKTTRNDNSSRFGKYMDIIFNYIGDPVGGSILNYLLEKSRVVQQAPGERNFHIFYQLLAGAEDEMLAQLQLSRGTYYYYLNASQASISEVCKEMNDAAQYRAVRHAMRVIELEEEEQVAIFQLVATVLHLGNVGFGENEGHATVLKPEALLGCSEEQLSRSLTQRTIEARGDTVTSPLNRGQAIYARDALAKAIYDRLFTWLVQRLNSSLKPPEEVNRTCVMGILDIYGFEIFEKNSFEQFCINFCNEKLQQLFIELTLKSEQEEYFREGIEWVPVEYFDNKVICNLIEEKHKGIVSFLDEECLRPGATSDQGFLNKMNINLKQHKHYISHSMANSKMQKIMRRDFKKSVNQLMKILTSKEPSYIRCIKPNETKRAVKYLGLLENLRVRRAGFAYRRTYENFLKRYKALCPETWPSYAGSAQEGVQILANHMNYTEAQYKMGKTKIFIRLPQTLFKTEDAFQLKKHDIAIIIQKTYRCYAQRKRYLLMIKSAIASKHLYRLHRLWLSRKYRLALTPVRKRQLELKVLAEKLFSDKKKTYPSSLPPPFVYNRLPPEMKLHKEQYETNQLPEGEKLKYSALVTKYDRHGYTPRQRVLMLTNKMVHLLDSKSFKIKHRIALGDITELLVTSESDGLLLMRIPLELKKDKVIYTLF
ncbi:hypothetical protein B566_EDAN001550 [Ephemera danica]|nr:hypothetical protein B566_EDAN001550 [Ephemera danica]